MRTLKNEKGYALFVSILLIALVATIGLSLQTLSSNAKKTTVNEQFDQATFYYAEAGINLEKATIMDAVSKINSAIQSDFGGLNPDPKEQAKILDHYGTFESYYYAEMNARFLPKINELSHKNPIQPSSSNEYERRFNLTPQSNKQPVAKTTVSLDCSTKCKVSLESKGYFASSPSNYRLVEQELTIKVPPIIPDSTNGNGNADNGGNGGSTTGPGNSGGSGGGNGTINPVSGYGVIANKNITLTGSGTINGGAASLEGQIRLDGGAKITGAIAASDPSKLVYPNWMTGVGEKYTPLPNLGNTNSSNPLSQFLPEFPDAKMTAGNSIAVPKSLEYAQDQWNKTMIIENGNFNASSWMTNNYTLKLGEDTKFSSFNVGNNNTITIDVGDQEVNLFVDNLNIQQGHIKIIGTGKLNIYANNITSIKGSFNNNGNPASVNMYYNGTKSVTFSGETQIYGSFYTKSSDLKLTGGAGFYGNLYSGGSKVEISGGVPSSGQWLVAPNASLNVSGGGNIRGTVIADSITMSGGTTINAGEAVVPNPALPSTPSLPSYQVDTSGNPIIEGPLLEQEKTT